MISAGLSLAGQRVTLRLDGPVAHILSGGILVRTIACPIPHEARSRLRGARPGTAQPPRLPDPLIVTRRVSVRGAIMVSRQKIQVGLAHARKSVDVAVESDTYRITVEPGITVTAPRTTSRDIRRHKASHYPLPVSSPRLTSPREPVLLPCWATWMTLNCSVTSSTPEMVRSLSSCGLTCTGTGMHSAG